MPAEGFLQQHQQQQQYYQQQASQPQYFQQQQQLNPLQQATAEPSTEAPASTGCRKLANGQSAPCAKVYEDEPQQQQQQEQPIAIPQTSGSQQAVVYGPQQQQQQRQLAAVPQAQTQPQQQYYQTSVFDPLGMFRQNYATGSAATPQQQHPQMYQHSAIQAIPQPNHSYNPYWPFQGYYDYSQNPSAAYGVQTAQGFQSPHPLFAQGTKTPVPRPQPLPVPTIEEVEKS
uniref:Uncharacterized protein n=1 Tax=Panagrolaimus sp. PS1159 TaxID=55785 RepID=A0AC35G8R9_9BILA